MNNEKIKVLDLIKDIKEDNKNNDISIDELCNYDETRYLSDLLNEIADNNVSIYNYDLLEWCKYNYEYVEQAIDELGTPTDRNGKADFFAMIRQGQYIYNYEEISKNLFDMIKIYILYLLDYNNISELTEEEEQKIDELAEEWCNDDILGNINDIKGAIFDNE